MTGVQTCALPILGLLPRRRIVRVRVDEAQDVLSDAEGELVCYRLGQDRHRRKEGHVDRLPDKFVKVLDSLHVPIYLRFPRHPIYVPSVIRPYLLMNTVSLM